MGKLLFYHFRRLQITEDHSVAASHKKNDHILLYLVIMKVKNNFLYEIVNRG